MRVPWKAIGGVLVTTVVVLSAVASSRWLWIHYNLEPWTRDGRIRADIVQVSPDVSGLVSDVLVKNDQPVHAAQNLFVIDRRRFELAQRQAEASVLSARTSLAQAEREDRRNRSLGPLVTTEQVEEGESKVEQLRAQLLTALVELDVARLNLQRSTVRAPVDGVVTNVELQPGDYASAGHQVLALLAVNSIHVDGYFEETKLPQIQVGDRATVRIMGLTRDLTGRVESIAAGIEDRERGTSGDALANVNPTFSWVRLAQRVPVRIKLDPTPPGVRLIAGRTVTVAIQVPPLRKREGSL